MAGAAAGGGELRAAALTGVRTEGTGPPGGTPPPRHRALLAAPRPGTAARPAGPQRCCRRRLQNCLYNVLERPRGWAFVYHVFM